MHTIKGCPAEYWDNKQIVYSKRVDIDNLCKSLYMIRKQQELSNKWRESQGFGRTRYEYMIVLI